MRDIILIVLAAMVVLFNASLVKGEPAMISDGKIVKFNYVLTVENQVVDSSQGKEPLQYTHGQKMIIPGLESKLAGLQAGDKKIVVVGPEDAYGVINQEAILEVPTDKLGANVEPQVGMMLQLTGPQGQPIPGKIIEVREASVIIDFNHPLAGKELQFEVEIIDVK